MLLIRTDVSDVRRELERLENIGPTMSRLDEAFNDMADRVNNAVHVDTSSLKWSEMRDSFTTDDYWGGIISYGGPSSGVYEFVTYAAEEKNRGGNHNYMQYTRSFKGTMGRIIKAHLEG